MDCPLQTAHMCLLKGILGVKRATPNWSVFRECGQEPLQFYWFQAAVRFYIALLRSNSDTLVKVLKAEIVMSAVEKKCWSAEFLDAFHGLERSVDFLHRVRTLQAIPLSEFVVDVRKRLRDVWRQAAQPDNADNVNKVAKYHNWVALPLKPVTVVGPPVNLPRYLHLYLGWQTQRNVARFRLHSHTLRHAYGIESQTTRLVDGNNMIISDTGKRHLAQLCNALQYTRCQCMHGCCACTCTCVHALWHVCR